MKVRLLVAASVCAIAVGCSGGSSSPVQTAPIERRSSVKIEVAVPSALVTSGVRSVVVAFVPVGEVVPPPVVPLTIEVASGSTDCAAAGTHAECSGTLDVPLGAQNFTVTLYAGPNGTGAQLGVKAITATITGTAQTIDISSASGVVEVVAGLKLIVQPNVLLAGTASKFTVTVAAFDAAGRPIASPYNVPVTVIAPPTAPPGQAPILDGPTPGPEGLGANGLVNLVATGPGQPFPFAYTGTSVGLPEAFTFSASALNVAPVTAEVRVVSPTAPPTATPAPTPTPVATVTPAPTPPPATIAVRPNVLFFEAPGQPAQTFVASAPGATAFSAVSSNTAVATVTGRGVAFSVDPIGAGTAVITVTDGAGGTGTVNVYVNQTTVIISGRRSHR